MKLSNISSLVGFSLCFIISDAAPAQPAWKTERGVDVLKMILFGAAEANYPLTVPLDCTPVYTREICLISSPYLCILKHDSAVLSFRGPRLTNKTDNRLSISQIKYLTTVAIVTHIHCTFVGVAGNSVAAPASDPPSIANWRWAMGPPQELRSVSCCYH